MTTDVDAITISLAIDTSSRWRILMVGAVCFAANRLPWFVPLAKWATARIILIDGVPLHKVGRT